MLPEEKPKTRAKTIDRDFTWDASETNVAGNQRLNVVIRHKAIIIIMVLNLPILSARRPGAHRPKKDPAFNIVSNW